jgi:Secretion system C-terminal sorting domain
MKIQWLNYLSRIKYSFLISYLIVCASPSEAQTINLVQDPSFEIIKDINLYSAGEVLQYWENFENSGKTICAFFSYDRPVGCCQLPITQWCNQYPKSGKSIICFEDAYYQIVSPNSFHRSIVRTKLKSKLIAGKQYCIKANAVFGEYYSRFISDGIDFYLDNGQLDTMVSIHNNTTGMYPNVIPQLRNAQGNVLTDTINWNLLMGSFIANGTEEYLTISNFKSDTFTTKVVINQNSNNPISDYLIDDVCVYPIDLANWLPPSYGCAIGDTAVIGLPNYETPDAKWFTYNMVLIDSGSQIKVKPTASGTKYICGIDMCNTMVFDTVEVRWFPLSSGEWQMVSGELSVYPNPASDVIQVSNIMGDKVSLYNTVGQLVAEQKVVQNKAELQVAHLPKGLYVVKTAGQVAKVVIR